MWPLKIVSTPYRIGEPLGMNMGTMTIGKMILPNMDLGRIISMTPMIHIVGEPADKVKNYSQTLGNNQGGPHNWDFPQPNQGIKRLIEQ